jgi:radical SAM enzyme (TIGR01210 family)
LDPSRPYAWLHEHEPALDPGGEAVSAAAVFLTNRECPWRCLHCDLWAYTTRERTPRGAIPAQIRFALEQLPAAMQVKLYNAGSFFDVQAVPAEDLPSVARAVSGFQRVVVECHPSLVGAAVLRFRDLLAGGGVPELELALGLETADPEILARLNKGMTPESFARAAAWMHGHGLALRSFVLVGPPFVTDDEAVLRDACRSVDFALDQGSETVTLIPTRAGNGALDRLAREGLFRPPSLSVVESALKHALSRAASLRAQGRRLRVLVDLWDLEAIAGDEPDVQVWRRRLARMNAAQAPGRPAGRAARQADGR